MAEAPSIALRAARPLGPGWPAIRRWEVTGEDGIDGVELQSNTRPDWKVLAHRATHGQKRWQATWFDERGPGGDIRRDTLEQALNEQAPAAEYHIVAIHVKSERSRNPMSSERKTYYLKLYDACLDWADGRTANRQVRDMLESRGVAKRDLGFEGVDLSGRRTPLDRTFWLGEIKDDLLHEIERDASLTAKERSELERVIRARPHAMRSNPMGLPSKAIKMFRKFHTRDWRGEGDFAKDMRIPDEVACIGSAVHTLYASDKLNPTTGEDEGWIEYIHEHEHAVKVYTTDRRAAKDCPIVAVPAWIRKQTEFTWLGKSLGFAFRDDDGNKHDVDATEPLPELYTIPSGKALFVIQSKRTILAMFWGGRLAVERRGIVY